MNTSRRADWVELAKRAADGLEVVVGCGYRYPELGAEVGEHREHAANKTAGEEA
jgi:hypothetical protein